MGAASGGPSAVTFTSDTLGKLSSKISTSYTLNDNDTFVWNAGDAIGNSVDIIKDFSAWNGTRGDKLDISKLLTNGYNSSSSTLSQWVTIATAQIAPSGTTTNSTKITIDIDGAGAGTVTQTIWLDGVNLTLNGTTLDQQLSALRTNGILIA